MASLIQVITAGFAQLRNVRSITRHHAAIAYIACSMACVLGTWEGIQNSWTDQDIRLALAQGTMY